MAPFVARHAHILCLLVMGDAPVAHDALRGFEFCHYYLPSGDGGPSQKHKSDDGGFEFGSGKGNR